MGVNLAGAVESPLPEAASSPSPLAPSLDVSPRRLGSWLGLWLVAVLVQVALYSNAVGILPTGDDWTPPLFDINRAHRDGVWSMLTVNYWAHPMWRPLQSLVFLGLDKLPGSLFVWVTVLNQICFALAAAVVLAWVRTMRLPLWAGAIAAAVFAVHPANVAAVASVDGFGSILMPATAWGLCLVAFRLREKPIVALSIVAIVLAVASGVKEYIFATVPMACVTTLLTYRRPIRWTLIFGVVLSIVTGACLGVRHFLHVPRIVADRDVANQTPGILKIVPNTLAALGVSLYPGNTVTFFTTGGTLRILVVATGVCLTGLSLAVGLALVLVRARRVLLKHDAAMPALTAWRWIALLVLTLLNTVFPANVAMRMSEMYVLGTVIGIALLAAWAGVGIAALRGIAPRRLAILLMVILLGWSARSTRAKISEVRESGLLSWQEAHYLNSVLPADRRGLQVAIVYDADEVKRYGQYSVFRANLDGLMGPYSTLEYFRPGSNDLITPITATPGEDAALDTSKYDVVIHWGVNGPRRAPIWVTHATTQGPTTQPTLSTGAMP